jgi:hypothetical protein
MRHFAICRLLVIFAAALLVSGPGTAQDKAAAKAAAKAAVNPPPKRHQATGTVSTSGATQLVLLKTFGRNQARWDFVLNPKTKLEGKPTKGARVRIYYYLDVKGQRVAEEIKILAPAAPPAAKTPAAASPAPPQQPH